MARRSTLYFDLVVASLSEAARKSLQAVDPAKYEYQSEFAKRYLSQGRAEGRAQGRAEVLLKQLTLRFGTIPEVAQARVQAASVEELEVFAERVLSASTLEAVLAPVTR